jgi:cytochrome c oxidase assembly factor CtaG
VPVPSRIGRLAFVLAHSGTTLAWNLEPLQLLPTLAVSLLYAKRAQTLARRGTPVPVWRQISFWTGIALVLVALVSPIDELGEEDLFFFHMLQHVILGDLAPLCFVVGLTGPILRPVLALPVVDKLRVLAHPLVALPLWAVDLVAWHTTPLYDAALDHDAVHALQHLLFFTCGALLWSALLELLPGPRWFRLPHRVGYVGAMWLVSLALSQVFLWSGHAYYPRYGGDVNDQRVGGGIMLLEGSLVMISVLVWLLWKELSPATSTASVAQPKPLAPQGVPSQSS